MFCKVSVVNAMFLHQSGRCFRKKKLFAVSYKNIVISFYWFYAANRYLTVSHYVIVMSIFEYSALNF